jgi:hypothetical protein
MQICTSANSKLLQFASMRIRCNSVAHIELGGFLDDYDDVARYSRLIFPCPADTVVLFVNKKRVSANINPDSWTISCISQPIVHRQPDAGLSYIVGCGYVWPLLKTAFRTPVNYVLADMGQHIACLKATTYTTFTQRISQEFATRCGLDEYRILLAHPFCQQCFSSLASDRMYFGSVVDTKPGRRQLAKLQEVSICPHGLCLKPCAEYLRGGLANEHYPTIDTQITGRILAIAT